jgi:hypothetical protein
MATDKLTFEVTVQEANGAVKPIYSPLYSLFEKKTKYNETIGQVTFKRGDIVGDVLAKDLTAHNTERKHITVGSGQKVFNKYFKGVSYVRSGYQQTEDINSIASKVIEVHNKQLDRDIFTGDPAANGQIRNNGIFSTNDANAITNETVKFTGTDINTISKFFNTLLKQSETLTGNDRKIILLGGKLRDLMQNFVTGTGISYKKALADIYPVETDIVELPANLNELKGVGDVALVLSINNIMLNYLALPQLEDQGYDPRNKESWFNFYFGSAMVDVEQYGALIKQPVTGLV